MTILLTGGTGKTSLAIAVQLQEAKVPFLLASRNAAASAPAGMQGVNFDWMDESTFEAPFQHRLATESSITAVYVIGPPVEDPVPAMNAFVDYAAKKHGVKRFVLLCGSDNEDSGSWMGKAVPHLADLGVEYCVLLSSWFMGKWLDSL